MVDTGHISRIAEEKLRDSELFLADVAVKPGNRIFVFLDGDRDVTIEDCVALSRHIQSSLPDEEDVELMVSSCGADQPLKMPRQFRKNLGRKLTVTLNDGSTLKGALQEIRPDGIILHPEKSKKKKKEEKEAPDQVFLSFDNIETAKVNLSFNK